MPQGTTQNPTQAQMTAQYNQNRVAQEQDSHGQAGYLWSSGLSQEDQLKMIFFRYQAKGMGVHFFMQVFLQFFGNRFKPVAQQDYSWFEMDKLRVGTTVDAIDTGLPANPIIIDTARTFEYHVVGEVLQATNGWSARITNVDASGGTEKITLQKLDGTNFTATDIVAGQELGLSTTLFGEGSSAPKGKTWRPEERWNNLQTSRRTSENTGDARTTESRVSLSQGANPLWVEANEDITLGEHLRDIENGLMFGRGGTGTNADTIKETLGILRDIEANSDTVQNYAGSLDEADIQAWFRAQNLVDNNDEFLSLAGSDAYFDFQDALRDFFLDGGVRYGDFGSKEGLSVGLNVQQYQYGSKVMNLKQYKGFNDSDVTGVPPAGPTATHTDYKKFVLMLNMGTPDFYKGQDASHELMCYRYKSYKGVNRLLVANHLPGMTGMDSYIKANGLNDISGDLKTLAKGMVATGDDKDQFFVLSQYGAQLVNTKTKHGYMRATS